MKKDLFENYQVTNLQSMTSFEIESINGGYSWDEFKSDVATAWNDFKEGVAAGWNAGLAAAKK